MTKRKSYIDRLKGIAIILVVMGHVITFSMNHPIDDKLIKIISSFHMPLFMFLSGFVLSSPPNYKKLAKRFKQLIIPFLTIGLSYTLYMQHSIEDFFTNDAKLGYWYLFVLFIFNLFLLLFKLNTFNNNNLKILCDIIIAIVIYTVLWGLSKLDSKANNLLSIYFFIKVWPFFIVGHLINKYHNLFNQLKQENNIYTISFIGTILYFCMVSRNFNSILFSLTCPFFVITTLFYIFVRRQKSYLCVERALEDIGKNTLEIYTLHYFLIANIRLDFLNQYFTNNTIIEFITITIIAIIIIAIIYLITYLIKQSKLLHSFLFGRF